MRVEDNLYAKKGESYVNLSESITGAKYKMELDKQRRSSTTVRITEHHHGTLDEGSTVYRGDIGGFKLFVAQMVEFRTSAEKFEAIEVPSL